MPSVSPQLTTDINANIKMQSITLCLEYACLIIAERIANQIDNMVDSNLDIKLTIIMKKYQSYAELKLSPTLKPSAIDYNKSPRLVGSPSYKKSLMLNSPTALISREPVPMTTKYSANYLQRKKVFSNKKENRDTNYVKYKEKENKNGMKQVQKSTRALDEGKSKRWNRDLQFSKQKLKASEQTDENSHKKMKISTDFKDAKCTNERHDIQSPKNSPDCVVFHASQSKNKEQKNRHKITKKPSLKSSQKEKDRQKQKKCLSPQSLQCHEQLFIIDKNAKKQENQLSNFVTKYQPISPSPHVLPKIVDKLTHCTSDPHLIKPIVRESEMTKKMEQRYYISTVYNSFFTSKPSSFQQVCQNHLITSIQFLTYVRRNKGMIPAVPRNKVKMKQPAGHGKLQTLVFDLDETLIHCNQSLDMPHDISVDIKFPNGSTLTAGVNVRPYAHQCLLELSKHFQIIVFTASHSCYANVIIDYLDPNKDIVSYRLFREHCHKTDEGFYVKDLRILDRNLANVLLIDNAAYSYCFQPCNGIPIIPFYSGKTDSELREIVGYLKQLVGKPDMAKLNDEVMRLGEYHKHKTPKQLISQLYL